MRRPRARPSGERPRPRRNSCRRRCCDRRLRDRPASRRLKWRTARPSWRQIRKGTGRSRIPTRTRRLQKPGRQSPRRSAGSSRARGQFAKERAAPTTACRSRDGPKRAAEPASPNRRWQVQEQPYPRNPSWAGSLHFAPQRSMQHPSRTRFSVERPVLKHAAFLTGAIALRIARLIVDHGRRSATAIRPISPPSSTTGTRSCS